MSLHEPAEMMKMVVYLTQHGATAIRQMEHELGIPYTTIRRRFSIWIEEGFLVKERRNGDSRAKWQYRLTDKGEKIGKLIEVNPSHEKKENKKGGDERKNERPSPIESGEVETSEQEQKNDTLVFTAVEVCEILAEIREDIFSLAIKARDERSLQHTFTAYIYKSYGYEI